MRPQKKKPYKNKLNMKLIGSRVAALFTAPKTIGDAKPFRRYFACTIQTVLGSLPSQCPTVSRPLPFKSKSCGRWVAYLQRTAPWAIGGCRAPSCLGCTAQDGGSWIASQGFHAVPVLQPPANMYDWSVPKTSVGKSLRAAGRQSLDSYTSRKALKRGQREVPSGMPIRAITILRSVPNYFTNPTSQANPRQQRNPSRRR